MALNELTDRTAVLRAIAEFDRLGRKAFLKEYGFRRARNYVLREKGKDYDSKAIAGAAFGFQFPRRDPLRAADFTGGENTVKKRLEDLDFTVVQLDDDDRDGDWSREEIELVIAAYFEMLAMEIRGERYNKTEHRKRLIPQLRGRSAGSIEFKHQNISAVLEEFDMPYIRGYKPRRNVQELLRVAIDDAMRKPSPAVEFVVDSQFKQPEPPRDPNFMNARVETPRVAPGAGGSQGKGRRVPKKINYVERDERYRGLGRAGEEWTMGYERYRLTDEGRADLAKRVRWVSDEDGDGAGYDILSFEKDGSERFIEVKTTEGPALTPFVVSSSEIRFSQEKGSAFYLYRIYDFRTKPQLFELRGDLTRRLTLEPLDFRARLKATKK